MLTALKKYLAERGYTNIYCNFMPGETVQPEAINLSEWDSVANSYGTGDGAHYIQIQVRRYDYNDAHADCKSIFEILNSGVDEKTFDFGGKIYICRQRRGPLLLERTEHTTTIYCEIVIFGDI